MNETTRQPVGSLERAPGTKCTPGPWSVVECSGLHDHMVVSAEWTVAELCGESATAAANALLIAAAPDMHDALREVCQAAITVSDGCAICGADLDGDPPHYPGCAVEIALAVLAKAEGAA